ncbi:hypothetical protein GA0115240_144877 [Streptomyces sp. DvalAA-14]|uniref:hypothetical protein n=1 Tax=unclassified Streptomyces TaxID=2593676 RepID=UPI00081BA36B|nr:MULTISPECIES: hypothetical protein [unclassified Streptomyces]MYS22820.1 hypothetical protein [Streptomyces sp. SID4948]SCE22834.1 hypothetical protein GA0115240_144877 [Streptomyces sp. DvalAA-14]
MSFNLIARKVRDTGLPHGLRVSQLRSCVQLYRPIGFHATLSFLKAKAGHYSVDEDALLRALEVLEASRAAWHTELRVFDEVRRRAKHQGARQPRQAERNPYREMWWSGAPREGALHALSFLLERRRIPVATGDAVAADLERCVVACLASGGALGSEQHLLLADCVRSLRARQIPAGWENDRAGYFRTRDLLRAARHVEIAAAGCVSDA